MENKQKLKFIKLFMLLYVAGFLVINWSDVSWIFNYRVVSTLVSDFFNPYPSTDAFVLNNFYPNHSSQQNIEINNSNILQATSVQGTTDSQNNQNIEKKNINYPTTDKSNSIEIPKINITAPIIFTQSTNKNVIMGDLNKGVVYYPGSVYPGQTGQIVILGHSAPLNWPKIKYEWVFSRINDLNTGDNIIINLNNKQYTYKIVQKTIIQRGQDVKSTISSLEGNSLTLISCWPPGKDYMRITVEALLQVD